MENDALCFLSLTEVSRLIANREIPPSMLVGATLHRIQKLDPTIGAYVTVMEEAALEAAEKAGQEIKRGNYRGPLHGVPISLKDLIYVAGVRNTAGSKVMANYVPGYDATVTKKLRDSGAIIIGKTQAYEFAFGPTTTYHFGPTRNPWDLDRVTTGSSSGSAAAVAASLCYASIGSDTGGSIRGPAAMCGVVGFKPTYGRVSRHGVVPLSWSLDHVGPIARTVADCAMVLSSIAGEDQSDPTSIRSSVPDYASALGGDIRGLKIGIHRRFFFDDIDASFHAAIEEAIRTLESAGAILQEVQIPSIGHSEGAYTVIMQAEAASLHAERIRSDASLYGVNPRTRIELGSLLLATDYLKAQRVRAVLQREFDQVMRSVDIIVTPVAPGPPPKFSELPQPGAAPEERAVSNPCRLPFNMVGAPAISVPCGFSPDELPIGLQIVGRPMRDDTVLKVAYTYEQMTDWHTRRPPVG